MTAEAYVQPRRSEYGRGKVFYSPQAVAAELAVIIKKSPLYAEFTHEMNPATGEEFVKEYAVNRVNNFAAGQDDYFALEIERTWGVSATLYLRRRTIFNDFYSGTNAVEGFRVYPCTYEASVSWSSTSRSVPTAQASVVLYQELINLAALLTSYVESFDGNIAELRPVN